MQYPAATPASLKGHSPNHRAEDPGRSARRRFSSSREPGSAMKIGMEGTVMAMSLPTSVPAGVSVPTVHCDSMTVREPYLHGKI